jgi:ATP-binding protein involved in chromosome partitioning
MSVSKTRVLEELSRIKGPDLNDNIVDLGLVSEILIKDDRVYFSITVPAARAEELEPLRQAAQSVVAKLDDVEGVTAVLTAEAAPASRAAASGASVWQWKRMRRARASSRVYQASRI